MQNYSIWFTISIFVSVITYTIIERLMITTAATNYTKRSERIFRLFFYQRRKMKMPWRHHLKNNRKILGKMSTTGESRGGTWARFYFLCFYAFVITEWFDSSVAWCYLNYYSQCVPVRLFIVWSMFWLCYILCADSNFFKIYLYLEASPLWVIL